MQNQATNGFVGYCLDVIDLFMSKLEAHREKDREFNVVLPRQGYVRPDDGMAMVDRMPVSAERKQLLRRRLRGLVRTVVDRGYQLPG